VPGDALRRGDVVEVRSASEILATLDGQGALDSLPFMPEMIRHCGRRFAVDKRAEKICDTIHYTGSRSLRDSVLLADLRCDGSAHDGCQAECRIFWKEAWLRRVHREDSSPGETSPAVPGRRDGHAGPAPVSSGIEGLGSGLDEAGAALAKVVAGNTKQTTGGEARAECYRCQATELLKASQHLRTWDPRPYWREFSSGNVSLERFVRVTARAAVQEPLRKLGLLPNVPLRGSGAASTREPLLDLQPGEWVQVKSPEEIAQTLTTQGKNRGLWFDREMLAYCGKMYRVRRRISRFIDDRNGQMVELKSDCVTLEDVVCSGDHSVTRWFCPRAIYPYWRECWLRRVSEPIAPQLSASSSVAAQPASPDSISR